MPCHLTAALRAPAEHTTQPVRRIDEVRCWTADTAFQFPNKGTTALAVRPPRRLCPITANLGPPRRACKLPQHSSATHRPLSRSPVCAATRHSIARRCILAGVCTNGTLLKRASCWCRCCCCCETRLPSSSSPMACAAGIRVAIGTGTLSRAGRDDNRSECRQETVISASSSPSINQGLAYARRRIRSACRNGEIAMHTRSVVRRATRRLFPCFPAAARASVA
jgi:hypothetical protein